MSGSVFLVREAEKGLEKIPSNIINKIKEAIREITEDSLSAGKSLRSDLKGYYSYRVVITELFI